MRKISFELDYLKHPAGSCIVSFGDTRVLCTASLENSLPPFLKGKEEEQGWLSAEYAMLPGSTGGGRKRRDGIKKDGRSTEIQRLIGRSLRAAVNLKKIPGLSVTIDCDVLQADGGTRTASISGAWVALYRAFEKLANEKGNSPYDYFHGQLAAVSVGIVHGRIICDLDYEHDSQAGVDMNIVMLDKTLVEVQGTAEKGTFSRAELNSLLDAAETGIQAIFAEQCKALKIQTKNA